MGDLINLYGEVSASGTGTLTLKSDLFTNDVTYIAIPKGFKCKIWKMDISGAPAVITALISKDGGTSFVTLKPLTLASVGQLSDEERSRPKVALAEVAGQTILAFGYSKTTADTTMVAITIEICREEEDS